MSKNLTQSDDAIVYSPLDAVQSAFDLLCGEDAPLLFDGTRFAPALPARMLRLDELKRALLSKACPASVRDAVWAELVVKARTEGQEWRLAAIGVAMPCLRATAGSFARGYSGDVEELDAEILAGFLAALASIDVDRPGIMTRLQWAVYRAGRRTVYAHAFAKRAVKAAESATPRAPWGHPDFVLAAAVRAGVITDQEAHLIGASRLENVDMGELAAGLGISRNAAVIRRQKGEARLVAHLNDAPVPSRTELHRTRSRESGAITDLAGTSGRIWGSEDPSRPDAVNAATAA